MSIDLAYQAISTSAPLHEAASPERRAPGLVIGRDWDLLRYLLSSTRRRERVTDADRAVDRAFFAGTPLTRSDNGAPSGPRYLRPAEVEEVAAVLGAMTRDDLARRYDPARMEAEGVYKLGSPEGNDARDSWERIAAVFEKMRDFFVEAAAEGKRVIVYVG